MNLCLRTLLIVGAMTFATRSHADLVLSFSFDGGNTFATETTILPGETQDLSVFLRETSPTTTLSTEGLNIYRIGFDYGISEGSVGQVSIASPFIDSGSTGASGGSGSLSGLTITDPVFSDTIALGTVEFIADGDGDGETTFVFSDFSGGDDVITGDGTTLDSELFAGARTFSATINVDAAAVPEPACWLVLGLAVGGVTWRHSRRRKQVA